MIYRFGDLKITDNSKESGSDVAFLATVQNSPYHKDIPKNSVIFTPSQLIERFGLDSVKIVGITGTNGKTTTAAAIYSLLTDLGYKSALQGTRGFFIDDAQIEEKSLTTPSILTTLYHIYEAKRQGVEYFVMEVSSHAIAQKRIEDLEFSLKVLTNISQDHLDYHKSMENYIAVKSSFFQDESAKLINKDDTKIRYNLKGTLTYGVENLATYQILAYSLEEGISAVLRFGQEMVDFYSPLVGLFNLYNILAAIASVHMLTGEKLEHICDQVQNFAGVKGRMEIVSYEPFVIVDFAHTPDGMQKVFESLGGKNLVTVFGAGGNRDTKKRALMGNIASRFCKKIYLTSDNPRDEDPMKIIEHIRSGIKTEVPVKEIVDREEAIRKALEELQKDEVLLILGKGDEEYTEIAGEKLAFSDVECVKNILCERQKSE